jgi:hypothetical protein
MAIGAQALPPSVVHQSDPAVSVVGQDARFPPTSAVEPLLTPRRSDSGTFGQQGPITVATRLAIGGGLSKGLPTKETATIGRNHT